MEMRVVCSWCGEVIQEGTGFRSAAGGGLQVSHGICPPCEKELIKQEGLGAEAPSPHEQTLEPD